MHARQAVSKQGPPAAVATGGAAQLVPARCQSPPCYCPAPDSSLSMLSDKLIYEFSEADHACQQRSAAYKEQSGASVPAMGASWSQSNSVWLQTDRPAYHDGDYVQGLVCLNIVEPVTITSIECQLLGMEQTYWTETRETGSGSHRHTYTETHGGKVQLLNVNHPLVGAGRKLAAGQYQWNVVFGLPVGLPSSFRISSGADGAEVSYVINLVFHTPGMLTRSIRKSQVLTVHQRLQSPPVIVDQSAELPLVACCCFNRGMMSAHVRLDRDKCQPGEEVQVILEVDNRSKLPVDEIELCIKREVTALEHPGGSFHKNYFHKELAKSHHPGLQPFTTLQGGLARRLQLRLPADLPPSMHGALITCNYFVKVKMKIGSFVKDIKLKVPLIVLAPQPQPTVEHPFFSEPPPFWSPTEVQPPEAISVPSAPPPPPELLQPDGPFWARSASNARREGDPLSEPLLDGHSGAPTSGYPVV